MNRAVLLFLALILSGCATIETGADHVRDFASAHPVITGTAAALALAAAAAAIQHQHDERNAHVIRCAPMSHGDVELPPGFSGDICQ